MLSYSAFSQQKCLLKELENDKSIFERKNKVSNANVFHANPKNLTNSMYWKHLLLSE